jgi:hypothetical protein
MDSSLQFNPNAIHCYMQISNGCDSDARLEWLLPYLLIYVTADRIAALPSRSGLGNQLEDTVPRSIVLSYLAQVISGLSQVPRSERNLFTAFFMPQLASLPGPHNPALRAQAANSLLSIANSALMLLKATPQAAVPLEDDASAATFLACLLDADYVLLDHARSWRRSNLN